MDTNQCCNGVSDACIKLDIIQCCKNVLDECSSFGNCMNINEHCRAALIRDKADINSTIIVAFVGFTILVYDHIITFDGEVAHVWQNQKFSKARYLFLVNRYLIPLGFIINLYAYQRPGWSDTSCKRFVRYEGVMTTIGINIASLMMLFRIKALYSKNRWIVRLVGTVLAIEFGVNVSLLVTATSVPHLVPNASCSMIFTEPKAFSSGSAWFPLLYDTIIFILTFRCTMKARKYSQRAIRIPIFDVLLFEGLLYYSVICTITLILTVMISIAERGVQNIAAQLELLLTVTMMSRITLHLKKAGHGRMDHSAGGSDLVFAQVTTVVPKVTEGFSQDSGPARNSDMMRERADKEVGMTSMARTGRLSKIRDVWWKTEQASTDIANPPHHPVSRSDEDWIEMAAVPCQLARDMC